MAPPKRPIRERLEEYIIPEPNSGCWLWLGTRSSNSYGMFWLNGRYEMAHRVVYEEFRAKISDGLTLDHLCRNTFCVNPNHLEPVTYRTNTLRGISLVAQNAKKTICKRGHHLSGNNLYLRSNGGRACKKCNLLRTLAYDRRQRNILITGKAT
jgi:hypothetical protein